MRFAPQTIPAPGARFGQWRLVHNAGQGTASIQHRCST